MSTSIPAEAGRADPLAGPRRRRRLEREGRAVYAVAGQLTQALASFALQVIAARSLGASGLGVFALLYSCIVFGTSLTTGFIGDSLTVLDRTAPAIRAALQNWCLLISAAAGVVATIGAAATDLVGWAPAIVFGVATTVFMIEDTLRRLLMASLRFWALSLVDLSGLLAALVLLGAVRLEVGHLDLTALLLALLLGQAVATGTAIVLLPGEERRIAAIRPAAMSAIVKYGRWRSGQRAVRSGVLTGTRVLVTAAVGTALYGQLEAARVYMAPALLLVTGASSYLLSTYAAARSRPLPEAVRRADWFSLVLLAGTLVGGGIATLMVPVLGPVVTGSHFDIDELAVLGWAVYAASSATVMPYGSLAAVRGSQAQLFALRLVDSLLSMLFVCILLFGFHTSVSWAPFALAAGVFIGGGMVRRFMLAPLVRSEAGPAQRAGTGFVPTHVAASNSADG